MCHDKSFFAFNIHRKSGPCIGPQGLVTEFNGNLTVQVTVDSFPGQACTGQVTRIGDEPEFTPRNVATKEERLNTFYAVEVRLPNAEGLLKPGMPADATF